MTDTMKTEIVKKAKAEKKVLIFAGTTEGRRLAEVLAEHEIPCMVCVATEYGAQVMRQQDLVAAIDLRQGRMDEEEMRALMQQENLYAVVDATHPFAVEVSENIRISAYRSSVLYLRLKRDTHGNDEGAGAHFFEDSESCAAFLAQTSGNVLLTTGSKELGAFCAEDELAERLYVRVLPGKESIGLCEQAGIPGGRIIALQGPFSEELNYALMQQFQIEWMVTKESGRAGGFAEKLRAARKAGVSVCVIGNPEKGEGLTFAQTLERLSDLLGERLFIHTKPEISLVGMGMGNARGLTREAWKICRTADYVFGAQRLLKIAEELGTEKTKVQYYPYYLAEDILPCLEEIMGKEPEQEGWQERVRIAVLFSGDSGFYSGCEKLYRELMKWSKEHPAKVRIYPGISSVSYLAAAAGVSWQDAGIVSSHGKGTKDQWAEQLMQSVKNHEKTFVLTSGVEDVRIIGELMQELQSISIITGYSLSYPEEEVAERTPEECAGLEQKGIYTCLILNRMLQKEKKSPSGRDELGGRVLQITHGLPDEAFIRETEPVIPMTKEEIREVLISKLRLTQGAVVYDIGSGTGSVSVEIARLDPLGTVYALEHKEKAAELTRRNAERFGLENLRVIQAHAPEGLEKLPAPTHVFIGGSDGCLHEILETLRRKTPQVRVVVTAVSLETVAKLMELADRPGYRNMEFLQLQVSRAKLLGRHHLMQAENPIYLVSFDMEEAQ